jgi:hypothetical protein
MLSTPTSTSLVGAKPLYIGRRLKGAHMDYVFNSGGPGYVLNQAALRLLVSRFDRDGRRKHRLAEGA